MRLLFALLLACVAHVHAQSFCEKYTGLLYGASNSTNASAQKTLVSAVVVRAAVGLAAMPKQVYVQGFFHPDSPILDVFSGHVHYRYDPPDFTKNGGNNTDIKVLLEHLIAFFGDALGCNGAAFPAIRAGAPSMRLAHGGMFITSEDMKYFNLQIINSMLSFGVTGNDIATVVAPFLGSFFECGEDPVCVGDDCTVVATSTDASCVRDHEESLSKNQMQSYAPQDTPTSSVVRDPIVYVIFVLVIYLVVVSVLMTVMDIFRYCRGSTMGYSRQ